jgi:UDP-apiose/xylose synthase
VSIAALAEKMVGIYKKLKPEHAKRKFSILNVSSEAFYGKGYEDSDRRVPDISKAQKLLNWKPKTGLDEMLRLTMASYIQFYSEKRKAG